MDLQSASSNQLFLIKVAILLLLIAVSKSCDIQDLSTTSSSHQTLILISLDGFAYKYLNNSETPTLDSLKQAGVMAPLIPVFPSKTFPNHYTQVTGLYPENHGIISNRMYDQDYQQYFNIGSSSKSTRDGKWYQGEPVWVTARKQGLITACMFWPGSDAKIMGTRPNYYLPFNGSIALQRRVEQVLSWLSMGRDRPNLITLYIEQIDQVGHLHGPNSRVVKNEINDVDQLIGELLIGIGELQLNGLINLIIVSDHGMDQLSRDRVIFLDDYISLDQVEVLNWSPLLELIPTKVSPESILNQLNGVHPHLQVYRKENTPDSWHLRDHHRITPIVGLADPGWSIGSRAYFQQHPRAYRGGAHGYHPESRSMYGIFIASGPYFRTGISTGAIASVHLYELLCALLEIEPADNDGDLKVWKQLMTYK